MKAPKPGHIIVTDRTHGFPYSKGLMASSLTVSGLNIGDAFDIAEGIEQELRAGGRTEVGGEELRSLAGKALMKAGERYASTYLKWQAVEEMDMPLIILLGGATGVGKSTVATQLAARLGITRVVSTDAVREVLRSALSADLMPVLHVSSFEAGESEGPDSADPVIAGFTEQVQAVSVGIQGLIARAVEERTDMIIEGAHVVPGYLEGWESQFDQAVLVPVVMTVGSEDLHRSHFHLRGLEVISRPRDKYLASFDKIRKIQAHLVELALERAVPVVEVFDLDSTLQEIISIVVGKALERSGPGGGVEAIQGTQAAQDGLGEITRRPMQSRKKSWEILGGRKRVNVHER